MVFGGWILVNYNLVCNGVTLDYPDSIAEVFVAVLCHRFRYRYRIASSINIGRAIYVDGVILDVAEIDRVSAYFLYQLGLDMT